jgi:hypothetical protein
MSGFFEQDFARCFEDDTHSVSSVAHSQDTMELSPASSSDAVIELSDEDEPLTMETVGWADFDTTTAPPITSQTSLDVLDVVIQPKKKRKCNEKLPTITHIASSCDNELLCIFVQKGTTKASHATTMPVPLWGQYTVRMNGNSLGAQWLIISNYENWIVRLVDTVSVKSVRDLAKRLFDRVRLEFVKCLDKARRRDAIADGSCDGDDDADAPDATSFQRTDTHCAPHAKLNRCPEIIIRIGWFDLYCLNNKNRIVMRLDATTIKFINEWLVPLLRDMAIAKDHPMKPLSPDQSIDPVGFQFSSNTTPNIRNKVTWNPTRHAWDVQATNPKSEITGRFEADPSLGVDEFEEAKIAAYVAAIEAWNANDNSKRHRIVRT